MRTSISLRWLVVAVSAAMLLAVAGACSTETVEVPGETVVVEKVVTETVEVPGETVVVEKEVVKTVEVPGETVTREVVKEVMVPGETVVVEKEVVRTVEVPGQTVVVKEEVVKTVEVPGETIIKEVVKTVEVPGPERVVVKEVRAGYVTDPTTGKLVTAPQYGGSFTFAGWGLESGHVDAFWVGTGYLSGVLEKLSYGDWAVDRDVYDWRTTYLPWDLQKPFLAESWSQPDPLTYVIKIRQGVHWHDKPPMNGRELTAYDIEYNYHRYLGMGSGFTEASSLFAGRTPSLESITATDKYTLVFKLGEPQIDTLERLFTNTSAVMYPPEIIEQYGDAKDWKNLVGTGPFELVDLAPGSSATYVKNPNYWGYDEKYPENRLPYVDEMRVLVMYEEATKVAAMRSRKIDALGLAFGGWTQISSIDQVASLKRTNPEFQFEPLYAFSATSFTVNTQVPPFDDVRVRHALQMAINLDEIKRGFWRGYPDTTPQTYLGSAFLGYVVPYKDWPEEIQGYYQYDPAGAEALLDAVGLKRGADGVRFSTKLTMHTGSEYGNALDHSYVVKEYWEAIGIEVEHEVIDIDIYHELLYENKQWEGITTWRAGWAFSFVRQLEDLSVNYRDGFSPPNVNDPVYDAMVEAVLAADTIQEQQRLSREASLYVAEQHYNIWGAMVPQFSITQPWVVGYNGETSLGGPGGYNPIVARLWIDSELKEAMGY